MGKTKRYSPDNDDLTQVSHRVPRRDIGKINREASLYVIANLVLSPDNYVELPVADIPAELARDRRLDLIQMMAEEAVASFSEK